MIQSNKIWNLTIINNIDFKEKSFKFGNIYDVICDNSHATLQITFQVQLPIELKTSLEQVIELTSETPLFEMNQNINEILIMF